MICNWRIGFVLLVVMTVLVATATPQELKPLKSDKDMVLTTPERLKWVQIRPGNEMAVVYGDPSKAGELYATRFRFADGFKSPLTGILKMSTQPFCKARFCLAWAQSGMRHS